MPSNLLGTLQGLPSPCLLTSFFPPNDEIVERPRKRRKKAREDNVAEDNTCSDQEEDFVTLQCADFGLKWNQGNYSWDEFHLAAASQEIKPVPVVVNLRAVRAEDEVQLLVFQKDGTYLIDSRLSVEKSSSNLQELWKIRNLGYEAFRRERRSVTATTRYLLLPPSSVDGQITLQAKVLWRISKNIKDYKGMAINAGTFLETCFPGNKADTSTTWTPQDFYEAVHVPERTEDADHIMKNAELECQLYPFQKRVVKWLLEREGVEMGDDGLLRPFNQCHQDQELLPFFQPAIDISGRQCFVSHLLGVIVTDPSLAIQSSDFRGGILAEEMGLGKTVELLALIALHKRSILSADLVHDDYSGRFVKQSSATLIVVPSSIIEQWKREVSSHAPRLNALYYEGMNTGIGKQLGGDDLINKLLEQDVVLTTYNVLANEIHYAGPTTDRNLRHEKRFEARRSPLVQLHWWRVCLDEAQMVESGVSNAAAVAKMIPRFNSWGITGTPLRKDLNDLFGLLTFLRYEPICQSIRLWERLRLFKGAFRGIFGQIALRHTKDQVRDELQLPPQKRIVISTSLSQIEEQNYTHIFQQMCDDIGLTTEGAPLSDQWDPDSSTTVTKMRSWLTRLRQTCLHPEVGRGNRRALGHSEGPLRTVGEVLEVMIEQNEGCIRAEEKDCLMSKIQRGQIMECAGMSQSALDLWSQALDESRKIVLECRATMTTVSDQFVVSSEEDIASKDERSDSDQDLTAEKEIKTTRAGTNRQRLRAALELEHICIFFIGSAYYQLKSKEPSHSEQFQQLENAEEEAYEKAKIIRKEILTEALKRVRRRMAKVAKKAKNQAYAEVPEIGLNDTKGGIESRKLFEKFGILGASLNDQANQIDEWREKMIGLLLQPLVDDEEGIELHGDEYEVSTKQQEEVYVYMEALRAIIADRQAALNGQINMLIEHEMAFALDKARDGEGHNPELLISVLGQRALLKPSTGAGSLRGIISDLRNLAATLRLQADVGGNRAIVELGIVEQGLRTIQSIMTEQTKAASLLEKELDLYRDTMNHRIEYYRQLQQISDTVAPYNGNQDHLDNALLAKMERSESKLIAKIASRKAKGRYLVHLRTESTDSEVQRICVICQQSFEVGVLTVCGHKYGKSCFQIWWNEHRSCPVCKKHLNLTDVHQITYKPQELDVREEGESAILEPGATDEQLSIYSSISSSMLNQIKRVDLDGSFGTKIDTIARHLLWIKGHEPGAKSIVFSQYREFLEVLGRAFDQFKINFTNIDSKGGVDKFKKDPSVECFLLHAKGQSSGLNLVNATHVFLCEPLINTAIELQAIARIHRIGQHRPTTIWAYLVNETVEESIYDISVSRRLTHIGKVSSSPLKRVAPTPNLLESDLDVANSLEMQQAPLSSLLSKGPSGGEMVEKDDLWNCLFKKTKRRDTGEAHGSKKGGISKQLTKGRETSGSH